MEHNHSEGHGTNGVNEVTPEVSYTAGKLVIEIKDKHGNAPELEVSHEKVMHLIVISSDLKDYHHLHPEKQSNGKYVAKINLDRKSTRLNSSHVAISYAVFCLKKKRKKDEEKRIEQEHE